jgi:sugar-specific transcriptional regulator TrmB
MIRIIYNTKFIKKESENNFVIEKNFDLDEGIRIFTNLGLSHLQAKIYVNLSNLDNVTISQISKKSGIRRDQIYKTIPKLIEKGLIEKEISTPSRYRAVAKKEAASILLQIKTQQTKKISKETDKFLQKIENKIPQFLEKEDSTFIFIPKMKAFAIRINKELKNTKKTIDSLTTCNTFAQASKDFDQTLKNIAQKGVKFRVILTDCEKNTDFSNFSSINEWIKATKGEIRYILSDYPIVLAIHDKKNVLMSIDPTQTLPKSAGLFTNNPSLVNIVTNHFEMLWLISKKI